MKIQVRAHEIAALLDRLPAGVTTLSLDCFDTLLWRNVHAPRDVFTELDLPGGGVEPRIWAQGAAQRLAHTLTKSHEVTFEQLYRRLNARADDETVAQAVEAEMALEIRHAFAFAPVVALMREAKRRGLQVIVVSDMYMSVAQLTRLLTESAGADVVALIDRLFTSSENGRPKADGGFPIVLAALGLRPEQVLHVGDNKVADQDVPDALGLHTVHFRQFDEAVEQRLRLEAAAGAMIDPAVRVSVPAYAPHRAAVSLRQSDDPAEALGHDVMGPVLHAFAQWVKAEVDAMAAQLGKPVRPLFLMRDGYLPMRVYETLYPEGGAAAIELSRFAAVRASLIDGATLERFVPEQLGTVPLQTLARQLMLFDNEAAPLLKEKPGRDTARHFRKAVRAPDMARKILARSAKFADRLAAHLARAGVRQGDAVMLVDLGYNGSVQNIVTPALEKRLGLTVAGRYLLLREEHFSGLDKKGLLDTRHYEVRVLQALTGCVALLEQLCNIAQGSTVDYAADGTPIREESGLKSRQNALRDAVQAAAISFAAQAGHGVHRAPASDNGESRRRAAAGVLARLMYMPSAGEVALVERFDHDVNLGTKQLVKLIDSDVAGDGLRRQGLAYVTDNKRMFVPGELQRHGLPLNLTLFASSRFAMDLRNNDFDVGGVEVPVILAGAAAQELIPFTAYPTSEGYYRLIVPVGAGGYTAAVQLGALAEWVQVETVQFQALAAFAAAEDGIAAPHVADGMTQVTEGMYEAKPHGLLIVPPPADRSEPAVLTVIFRPLKWRTRAGASVAAA